MFLYAIGILPLIKSLKSSSWKQIWYPDDASCCGSLVCDRQWFDLLLQNGPKFGYFPNPSKSSLLVCPNLKSTAEQMFGCLDIKIVCDHRFLGGYLGSVPAKDSFVLQKVNQWVAGIKRLSQIAVHQPQAAFAALTESLQHEWTYLQRLVPNCQSLLEKTLLTDFLPSVFGCEIF